MANITPVALDQNKSDKCRVKSIKGFFKYNDNRENSGALVKSLIKEIADGVYLNFIVRYFWCGENGNDCYLEIGWEPAYLNNGVRERYSKGLSEYFGADNACEVVINGESITLLAGRSDNKQTLDSYSMKIFDDTLEPAWIGMVNSLDPSIKNIEITFNYANSQNDGIDTYINIDGLNKVKILRPSKYENNVVFNRDGLNEMIDYFKKYPVVDLTTSEKYGHIKISHGNPENDIDIAPYGFEAGTQNELLCSTNFLPTTNNSYTLGQVGMKTAYNAKANYYLYKESDNKYYKLQRQEEYFNESGIVASQISLPEINSQFMPIYVFYIPASKINLVPFKLKLVHHRDIEPDNCSISLLNSNNSGTFSVNLTNINTVDKSFDIEFYNFEFNTAYHCKIEGLNNRTNNTNPVGSFAITFKSDEELSWAGSTKKWKNLYLSDTLSANNGFFNNEVSTNKLMASQLYGVFHGTEDGESININDNFIVNANGDVSLKGDITWGVNQFIYVYHKGKNYQASAIPPTPTNDTIYDDDVPVNNNAKVWHKNYNSNVKEGETDHWISMTFDGGQNWSTPTYINAKNGEKGDDGYWTNENILEALNSVNQEGLFSFPNGTGANGKLGINASVIRASLAQFNKIQMDPGANYIENTDHSFNGGYISFAIPTPLSKKDSEPEPKFINTNNRGWRARLGYIRGNGDGQTATAGIGFAIYTDATWDEAYPNNKISNGCGDNTSSASKHLILSILMFTQSGLGRLTVENTRYNGTSPYSWLNNDVLKDNNNNVQPHYGYTWWGKSGNPIVHYNRLWLDEDNGCIYESTNNGTLNRKRNLGSTT